MFFLFFRLSKKLIKMEGESSAKRSRVESSDSDEIYEINDISNSPQSINNVEDFVKIAKDFINDHSNFANNPSLYKICQVYVKKMFVEWHKKNENSTDLTLDSENTPNSSPNPEQFDEKTFIKFVKIHQIIALKNLFTPEYDFCGLDSENADELSMNEIYNYGLVKNYDGIFTFSYKNLRDFFAAEYILEIFKRHHLEENCDKCVKIFIDLMLGREYEVIRKFIDEGLAPQEGLNDTNRTRDQNEADNINLTIDELEEKFIDGGSQNSIDNNEENSKKDKNFGKKLLKEFKEPEKFIRIFKENLENFINFFITIFQNSNKSEARKILLDNTSAIFQAIQNPSIFQKFMNFIFDFLNSEDLTNLIKHKKILQDLPNFKLCSKVAATLTSKIEEKFSKFLVREALLLPADSYQNILFIVTSAHTFTSEKFKILFDILEKYLTDTDIENILQSRTQNVLHVLVFQEIEIILRIVWKRIKKHFTSINAEAKFKKLIMQASPLSRNRSVLHCAANCKNYDFLLTLWRLVDKTFTNSMDLKDLVIQSDRDKNNFVHTLVTFNNEKNIELSFKFLRDKLDPPHLKKILQSRGFKQRNMIQKAADMPNNVSVHQCLWKIIQTNLSIDEFKQMLTETDKDGQNVLHVTTSFSPGEVFNFMIQEIDKILSRDEIRVLLSCTNSWMENILQSAVKLNLSQSLHESLLKTYQNYFESEEIVEIIRHPQKDNCNLMHVTVAYAPKSINELTWNQIKNLMNPAEQKEYLSTTGFRGMTLDLNCRKMNKKFTNVQYWINDILREYGLM